MSNSKHYIIAKEHALQFILAGRAKFVLCNTKTNNRFTYTVNQHKDKEDTYWVNWEGELIGVITYGYMHKGLRTVASLVQHKALRAFHWYFNKLIRVQLESIPEEVMIHHVGMCGRCGLDLTDKRSIELGFGAICWAKIGQNESFNQLY